MILLNSRLLNQIATRGTFNLVEKVLHSLMFVIKFHRAQPSFSSYEFSSSRKSFWYFGNFRWDHITAFCKTIQYERREHYLDRKSELKVFSVFCWRTHDEQYHAERRKHMQRRIRIDKLWNTRLIRISSDASSFKFCETATLTVRRFSQLLIELSHICKAFQFSCS